MAEDEQREAFLTDLFVDPAVLTWDVPASASDLAKRVVDILARFRDQPLSIEFSMIEAAVREPNSQISMPEKYLAHLRNAGELYGGMCDALAERDDSLDVPDPWEARVRGWIHDLSGIYSDYEKTGQQSKELDLYFHAQHLGLPVIADEIAMHGCYLEILDVIFDGTRFPHSKAYEGMRSYVRQGDTYATIEADFFSFKKGRKNLPLIALTVADLIAVDNRVDSLGCFSLERFEDDWNERTSDILTRYNPNGSPKGEAPTVGLALLDRGGLRRWENYKNLVNRLLTGSEEDLAQMRDKVPGLWR